MKYVTFVIMAALIFGVAAAPVFSGTAFAQEQEPKYTDKEKKEQRSDESKQQRAQQQDREETDAKQQKRQEQQERRTASEQLQEQRRAELAERNRLLMERFAEQERIDRERMQERMDRMEDRSPMTEAMNRLNQANSSCGTGTVFDPITNSCILEVVNSNVRVDTPVNAPYRGNVVVPNVPQNTAPVQTGTYFENLREVISEQKRSQDILFRQITMLLNLVDSMCDNRVVVASVSDGALRCIDSDRAFNMHSRGLVTIVG